MSNLEYKYADNNGHYYSPTLARRLGGANYKSPEKSPEKSPKKERKWTLGNIFRRKKKEDNGDTSSEEDHQKLNFLHKRKRKTDKKKNTKVIGTFDHIVVSPIHNNQSTATGNSKTSNSSTFTLSDSGSVQQNVLAKLHTRSLSSELTKNNVESLNLNDRLSPSSLGSASADSLNKKSRLDQVKARAEARRGNLKHESSSDEDSHQSTSSISRFKSDDSLSKRHSENAVSRKSRTARTERYVRRFSKDIDLDPKLDCVDLHKLNAGDSETNRRKLVNEQFEQRRSLSRSPVCVTPSGSNKHHSPLSQAYFSGLSTIPPSHSSYSKIKSNYSNGLASSKPPLQLSNTRTNEYDYRSTLNALNIQNLSNDCRSASCDSNIHTYNADNYVRKRATLEKLIGKQENSNYANPVNIDSIEKQPPLPPPRDPRRLTYSFEKAYSNPQLSSSIKFLNRNLSQCVDVNKSTSLKVHSPYRSTSEDHISNIESSQNILHVPRPSSVSPEGLNYQKQSPLTANTGNNYRYFADKQPRSRKPIGVVTGNKNEESFSKEGANNTETSPICKPKEFWKQKEAAFFQQEKSLQNRSVSYSPQMFTSQIHVRSNVFLPSVLQVPSEVENISRDKTDYVKQNGNSFKPISPIYNTSSDVSCNDKILSSPGIFTKFGEANVKSTFIDHEPAPVNSASSESKRKSSNLEDALNELEAIYNSLHLGDDDLLERAELRESSIAKKNFVDSTNHFSPGDLISRGALSDSGFSYEPFDNINSSRRKRHLRKISTMDRKDDDMAFRKLNKERSMTINDPQAVLSKISYLLTSPVYGNSNNEQSKSDNERKCKEPDITLDDVVYRNIKYNNSFLKTADPQPLFGIPLGPISPAANSDYLHAVPDITQQFIHQQNKIPDIVKDDLAFRTLRKDDNKQPALPPLTAEDYTNNNNNNKNIPINSFKKKKAVRSLSANIYNLMLKESEESSDHNKSNSNDLQSLSDVADAMEIARNILKEKENKIKLTRKAFMSDDETKYSRNLLKTELFSNNNKSLNVNKSKSACNTNNIQQKVQVYFPLCIDDSLKTKPPLNLSADRKSPKLPCKEQSPQSASPEKLSDIKSDVMLNELLNNLAAEASETSKRITDQLKMLGQGLQQDCKEDTIGENQINNSNYQSSVKEIELKDPEMTKNYDSIRSDDNSSSNETITNEAANFVSDYKLFGTNINDPVTNQRLSEIDSVSEHAKLCEKILEGVIESTELINSSPEKQGTRNNGIKNEKNLDENQEEEHDYVNIHSDEEITNTKESKEVACSSSQLTVNDKITYGALTELGADVTYIDDDVDVNSENSDKYDGLDSHLKGGGETCANVDSSALTECALSLPNVEINLLQNVNIVASNLFSSNNPETLLNYKRTKNSMSLRSPKLVLLSSNSISDVELKFEHQHEQLSNSCVEMSKCNAEGNNCVPNNSHFSRSHFSNCVETSSHINLVNTEIPVSVNNKNGNSVLDFPDTLRHTSAGQTVNRVWHRDPAEMMLTCCYGVACTLKLASLDFIAFLGLLFAIISLIALLVI